MVFFSELSSASSLAARAAAMARSASVVWKLAMQRPRLPTMRTRECGAVKRSVVTGTKFSE